MKKSKVILLLLIFSLTNVFANSIQVFTTNTMHLEIDKNSKFIDIFSGDKKTFLEESIKINTELVKKGVVNAGLAGAASAAAAQTFKRMDANGGLVGLAVVATVTAGMVGFEYLSQSDLFRDYEYLYIAKAFDKIGNETLFYTYIISEDKMSNEEIKKASLNSL